MSSQKILCMKMCQKGHKKKQKKCVKISEIWLKVAIFTMFAFKTQNFAQVVEIFAHTCIFRNSVVRVYMRTLLFIHCFLCYIVLDICYCMGAFDQYILFNEAKVMMLNNIWSMYDSVKSMYDIV